MNILILGGNGYLGSKIINSISYNENIYCTIREGEELNLLKKNDNIHLVNSNIENVLDIINKISFDIVINTVCCYERNNKILFPVIESNLIYPTSVLSFAIEHNVKKIITVDTALPENVNLYSITKKTVAKIGDYYCNNYPSLIFFNIKLENFYGEDEPKNRFLHTTIDKLKKNEDILLTEGTQKRDFIYIDDVIQAIKILIYSSIECGYYDVPIGTGEGPSIREVVEYLKTILNSKSNLIFGAIKSRKNEPNCIANIEFIKKYGFKLEYPYKKGLKKLV